MVPGKLVLGKMSFKNYARKFKRLFHFYQFIPLHTQKNVWRLRHDRTYEYVPNCRTLKESRKICCRVLGFHRLITSQHSTHTPRCSTPTPRFSVSEFPGDQISGDYFPGDQFSENHFSGDHFSGIHRHIYYIRIIFESIEKCDL